MMPLLSFGRGKRSLAISIGEDALRLAEVSWGTDAAPTARVADFIFPPGCTLEEPGQLGAELASFLKAQNLLTRRVTIGVPAKWLIVRPYDMPPADSETAASVLWLYATDQIMPALGPMAFDYLGDSSETDSKTLLLVGLQQRWMDRLLALASAARLKVVGIIPVGIAVGATTARHVQSSLIALFGPGGVELIEQDGPHIRSIRSIRSNGSAEPVIAELRKAAATLSFDAGSRTHAQRNLVIWDDRGMTPAFLDAVRRSTSLPITEARWQWVDISESAGSDGARGLSTIALTSNERYGHRPDIDFLNPRLAAPKRERWRQPAAWLPWAVAAVILIALGALADMSSIQKQISGMDYKIREMQPALEIARPYVANMQFAESFRATRPRYLACIGDLTQALPADGQTYLTGFNLQTDMKGDVSGKSSNEQNVLTLRDKLNSSGPFSELTCKLDAVENHGNGNEVSFLMTFVYLPRK